MTQFLEIINLLSNPTAILPNTEQQKLIHEFERLKESDDGWKECIQFIITNQNLNDQTKFFCMQVVENFLKKRYKASVNQSDQEMLKSFMTFWIQIQLSRKANEKNFLTKKAAQLFALVSLIDFPNRWQTFFKDLIVTSQWSVGNADFYLKVLMAIDSEIVDRELPRTVEEAEAIRVYKDAMREYCVQDLVDSWYALLKEHGVKSAEITCQTLEVIGKYISWIDINLIVNERFIEFFSLALNQVDLRETTCSCLDEIVQKGMKKEEKLKLIEDLWSSLLLTHANALDQQINLSNDEQDNCDYLLKFGKLLNTIGEFLFEAWSNSKKEPDQGLGQFKSLENKLPYVLKLLNHSDDDISESVSPYCMHYISILKHNKQVTHEQQIHIESILTIVINKLKYDDSFNFENEGEDEAMFLEYRKNMKGVLDSIAQLEPDLVLTTIKNLVLNTAKAWQTKSYIEIENSLYLLYSISEALPPNTYKNECLCEMLQAVIASNLVDNPHRIVKLQYFENLARYFKFFQIYPVFFEAAIGHFIGKNGLHTNDLKLRSRVSYLFSRFTKDLRNYLNNYVEIILNSVQDLLVIWNPLETNAMCLAEKFEQNRLIADDQLFLYETVSLLVVTSAIDAKLKAQFMKNILTPIINTFLQLANKYLETSDEKIKLIYATSLNTAMSLATRVTKGFSNTVKVKDCECTDIFIEILRIFFQAINITTHKNLIHAGVRQYMHRMIICIDNEVLEYIPSAIEQFLKVCNEPRDIYDLLPLVNQSMVKYKVQLIGFMQAALMQLTYYVFNFVNSLPAEIASCILKITPQQIQNMNLNLSLITNNNINSNNNGHLTSNNGQINGDSSNSDISSDVQYILDIQSLYKAYFQFLHNAVHNDLMNIFLNQTSDDLYRVYNALLQGAQNAPPDTSKICFQIIKKFIQFFADKPVIENFIQYTTQNLVPCCLQVFNQNIDLNDAQQVLVLNEIGQCLVLLYTMFGDDFIKYIETSYLPSLNLPPEVNQGLVHMIKNNNPKALKTLKELTQPKKKPKK